MSFPVNLDFTQSVSPPIEEFRDPHNWDCVSMIYYDEFDSFLMAHHVGWDSEGNIGAEYTDPRGNHQFMERIGWVDPKRDGRIEAIYENANQHFRDVANTLRRVSEERPIHTAIAEGYFQAMREGCTEVKIPTSLPEQKLLKVNQYIEIIQQRMKFDYQFKMHVFGYEDSQNPDRSSIPWNPIQITDGRAVIRDYEIPIEALYARLLLANRYSKTAFPNLEDLQEVCYQSRKLRLEFINILSEGYGIQSGDVEVTDYELYDNGVLVFKKEGTNFHYGDLGRFKKFCTPSRNRCKMRKIIDEKFINQAIERGFVPRSSRRKLEKFKGQTIYDAIRNQVCLYGNWKRFSKISREEIDPLEREDRFLYNAIYYLLMPKDDKFSSHTRKKVKSERKDWKNLKTISKYLSGNVGEDPLSLSRKSAPTLLKVVKMFDWALCQHNCVKNEKRTFKRSSHDLRIQILCIMPEFTTNEVFTRTLDPRKLNDLSYLANLRNWDKDRNGRQAMAMLNMSILARSLSERMPTRRIEAARGNTASGKSRSLGDVPGILNIDFIKWALRRKTGVRNKQAHLESYVIFKKLFSEFEAKGYNYIVDLRLPDMNNLNTFVLDPARKHHTPVELKDFDVPLPTSLNRVLKRNPRGKDPCPALDPIVSGYQSIRKHRSEVIRCIQQEELVEEYHLHYLGKKVATKVDGEFRILDQELYEECLRVPTDDEIETILDCEIDECYIQQAIARRDLRPEELDCLVRWKGETVRNAIERHADS